MNVYHFIFHNPVPCTSPVPLLEAYFLHSTSLPCFHIHIKSGSHCVSECWKSIRESFFILSQWTWRDHVLGKRTHSNYSGLTRYGLSSYGMSGNLKCHHGLSVNVGGCDCR